MKYKYIRRSGKMNSSPVTVMAELVGVESGCTYTIKIPGNLNKKCLADNYCTYADT